MMRWLLWLAAGLLLAGIRHPTTLPGPPPTAPPNAHAPVTPPTETENGPFLPGPGPPDTALPFMDPAFATAVCRYDLGDGPLKLQAPIGQAYTSVSFYTNRGLAYYAINDRAAGRRTIELDLMTTQQRGQVPEDEEVTAADRLIVESPTTTGLIVVRGLASEPGSMPAVRAVLNSARCFPAPAS